MASAQKLDLAAPVVPTDHTRGSNHARVTIVEYGDFACPACKAAEPDIRMILERSASQVRLVYRHFPIESAHPLALMAAEAAEAAAAQGQFWAMHDMLLEQGARLGRPALDGYAAGLGLDMALFRASLDDEIYRQRVREQIEGAALSHLRGTPGFYVNGRICDTSGGIHALSDRVAVLLR